MLLKPVSVGLKIVRLRSETDLHLVGHVSKETTFSVLRPIIIKDRYWNEKVSGVNDDAFSNLLMSFMNGAVVQRTYCLYENRKEDVRDSQCLVFRVFVRSCLIGCSSSPHDRVMYVRVCRLRVRPLHVSSRPICLPLAQGVCCFIRSFATLYQFKWIIDCRHLTTFYSSLNYVIHLIVRWHSWFNFLTGQNVLARSVRCFHIHIYMIYTARICSVAQYLNDGHSDRFISQNRVWRKRAGIVGGASIQTPECGDAAARNLAL